MGLILIIVVCLILFGGNEAAAGGGCVIYGTPLANIITGVSDSGTATYTVTRGN